LLKNLSASLIKMAFEDYSIRNLQAKISAQLLTIIFVYHSRKPGGKKMLEDAIEEIEDLITDGDGEDDFLQIDFALRTLIYFVEKVEDQDQDIVKEFNTPYVPHIL
jgi:hypothetical protein